jgi:hypothetical protein
MVFKLDTTQWRVYSAEESVDAGEPFGAFEEARTFLWWVQSTRWWAEAFPNAPRIELEEAGAFERDGGTIYSYAQRLSDDQDSAWRISLHRSMLSPLVLLHEIAHCVKPRSFGNMESIRRGHPYLGRHHAHGDMFAGAYAALAERYGMGIGSELREAFEHFEVPVASLDDVMQARIDSHLVENEFAKMMKETEAELAADLAHQERLAAISAAVEERVRAGEVSAEPVIPTFDWGYWIHSYRRRRYPARMISQRALAQRIAMVTPCRTSDIARLERSLERPTEIGDLRIVLAAAAILDMDPLWVQTTLLVWPSPGYLTLDQLRGIASQWVELVEHLNGLVDARPPRWVLGVDR